MAPAGRKRRYAAVAAALGAVCAVVACVAVAQSSPGARAVAALQEMLCCEGCCIATASITSALEDREAAGSGQSGSPTVLQVSGGGAEIDYTSGGHRVSQHMESALSELDHLEDHVKDGRPKFLTESAAQREADLVSDKFAHQDLAGKARQQLAQRPAAARRKQMVDPYAKEEQQQLAQAARKARRQQAAARLQAKQQLAAEKMAVRHSKKMVSKVVEATQMSDSVSRQNRHDIKALSAPMHKFAKGIHQAESDAARAVSGIAKVRGEDSGTWVAKHTQSHVASARAPSADVFQPITSAGLGHELVAKAAAHGGQSAATAGDAGDAKEEAILRRLAQQDIDYLKSAHAHPVGAPRARAGTPAADAAQHSKTARGATSAAVAAAGGGAALRNGPAADGTAERRNPGPAKALAGDRGGGKSTMARAKKPQGGDEQRLNGVLDRITNLISSQTGGASRHPTYFKHFDDTAAAKAQRAELAAARAAKQAKLAAVHRQAAAKLAAAHSMQLSSRAPAAGVRGASDAGASSSQLRPAAAAGGRQGAAGGAQASSLAAGKGVGVGVGRKGAELREAARGGGAGRDGRG